MANTLSTPSDVRKTKARVCANCALRIDGPQLCMRLVDEEGSSVHSQVADRARKKLEELGPLSATCSGWRYPYMVSARHSVPENA